MKDAARRSLFFASQRGADLLDAFDQFIEAVVAEGFHHRQARPASLCKLPHQAKRGQEQQDDLPDQGVVSTDHEHKHAIDGHDERRDDHHRETGAEEIVEGDWITCFLGQTRRHNVGRRTDQGPVSTETGPKGQGPNHRFEGDVEVVAELEHDGDHGRGVGNVVDESRSDRRYPENDQDGGGQLHAWVKTSNRTCDLLPNPTDEAQVFERMDQHKQPGEEQERGPLDVVQRFLDFVAVGGHEHQHTAHQGNPGDRNVEHGVKEESDDDQREDGAADLEGLRVLDAVPVLEFLNVPMADTRQLVAEEPTYHHQARNDAHQDAGAHLEDEIVEGDPGARELCAVAFGLDGRWGHRASDHDVGGVPDHGGGATDVGEQNLCNEEWNGAKVEHPSELNGHGGEQQHGRYVVQKGRQHGGDQAQDDRQGPNVSSASFVGFNREPLEDPRGREDAHHDHHAEQKSDGFPIDHGRDSLQAQGRFLGVMVQGEDGHQTAQGCGQGSIDHFGDDHGVHAEQDQATNEQGLRFQASFDVNLKVHFVVAAPTGGLHVTQRRQKANTKEDKDGQILGMQQPTGGQHEAPS